MKITKFDSSFVEELLQVMAENDSTGELMWNTSLNFYILCNDEFWWGTADAELITPKTLPILIKAFKDGGSIDGTTLYCARQRNIRPQGAFYNSLENPDLFMGFPVREVGFGNPSEWGDKQ